MIVKRQCSIKKYRQSWAGKVARPPLPLIMLCNEAVQGAPQGNQITIITGHKRSKVSARSQYRIRDADGKNRPLVSLNVLIIPMPGLTPCTCLTTSP